MSWENTLLMKFSMIWKSAVVAVCCIAHSRQPQDTISLKIILNLVMNVIVKVMNPFLLWTLSPLPHYSPQLTIDSTVSWALYPEHIIFCLHKRQYYTCCDMYRCIPGKGYPPQTLFLRNYVLCQKIPSTTSGFQRPFTFTQSISVSLEKK